MSKEELKKQYCLEKGGINPSNIIESYYTKWLEYKLTEALKQSDNSELLGKFIEFMDCNYSISHDKTKSEFIKEFNELNQNNKG